MVKNFKFFLPSKIFFGKDIINEALPEVKNIGRNALVVTGKRFARETGLLEKVCQILKHNAINFHVFEGVTPEPSTTDCENVARAGKQYMADVIIAIGGGSAMDVAKAGAVLMTNSGTLQDYFGEEKFQNQPIPVVAIPTTCGSGSEVTRYAVIIDEKEKTKKTVSSERIIPKIAILDPLIIKTLPKMLIAGTGMDALCHAVEGFLSIKASHITKIFSIESIRLILENIEKALSSDENLEMVFLGSLYAGFVINHTGTIFVHGMAYGLTIKYRIHHGTANALCLPYAIDFLKTHGYQKEIKELEKFFNSQQLIRLNKSLKLPSSLKDIGLNRSDIPELSEMALKGCERSFRNMKSRFNQNDFEEIFTKML